MKETKVADGIRTYSDEAHIWIWTYVLLIIISLKYEIRYRTKYILNKKNNINDIVLNVMDLFVSIIVMSTSVI